MVRRFSVAAAVVLALVSGAAAVSAAAARNTAVVAHTLIVAVERNLSPPAEKKLAVLVLISRNGGAPAGAVATAGKPLAVHLSSSGLYRVKAEIDAPCKGGCAASARISGSADHKLEIVPRCRPKGSGFVCSTVEIVKVY